MVLIGLLQKAIKKECTKFIGLAACNAWARSKHFGCPSHRCRREAEEVRHD